MPSSILAFGFLMAFFLSGAVSKQILEISQAWQRYLAEQPLRFIDRELFPHLVHSIRCLSSFVGMIRKPCIPTDLTNIACLLLFVYGLLLFVVAACCFLGAKPQDLVILPNVTTGLNTVIRNVDLSAGDSIYMLSIGYGSSKKIVCSCC